MILKAIRWLEGMVTAKLQPDVSSHGGVLDAFAKNLRT